MRFNPETLKGKRDRLDEVLRIPGLVERVVARHVRGAAKVTRIPRVWEPGGGASLFRVEAEGGTYFLKAKHQSVAVESRLECEAAFSATPSLRNEHEFLRELAGPAVPAVRFYEEAESFCFLAVEWLDPFDAGLDRLDPPGILAVWERIEGDVRDLFARGIVHTDVHEHNLRFRGERPVLCDFEEARRLVQDVPFERSLDYEGRNRYGDVGRFPDGKGAIEGFTCLVRLRRVLQERARRCLPEWLGGLKFDCECPYNLDPLQAPDDRIYQSVSCGGLVLPGQRGPGDRRFSLLEYVLLKAAVRGGPVTHLDVGCNLGTFCVRAASLPFVERSVGVDAHEDYVRAARVLAFLSDAGRASFHRRTCGVDRIAGPLGPFDVISMLSVYHHVADRDAFLDDVAAGSPRFLLAEFAVQDRYYPDRGTVSAEIEHVRSRLGFADARVVAASPDYGRPLVLFARRRIARLDRVVGRLICSRFAWIARAALAVADRWVGSAGRRAGGGDA